MPTPTVITVGTFSVTLVPALPVPLRSVEFNFMDSVATNPRPFT
jgi:hypothetical protein